MKTKIVKIYFFFVIFWISLQVALAQTDPGFSLDKSPLPAPTGPVMDYAGVLSSKTLENLEKKINEFKENTNPTVELGVVIVKTTGERPIFDYSLAVARGWGIGSRDDDNPSALLFIAIEDRKYFTQVSRDLEDELPDGLVGSLQRRYLVPQFKLGNYSKGVEDTIDAYIDTIKAKQNGGEVSPKEKDGFGGVEDVSSYGESNCSGLFICLIIILIILFIGFSNSGGGGGGGGGRNRKTRHRSNHGAGDFLSGLATGILIDVLTGDGGGSSSGGSSWGGGSSGGGWGGFGGGGDFGGGGAGGGW